MKGARLIPRPFAKPKPMKHFRGLTTYKGGECFSILQIFYIKTFKYAPEWTLLPRPITLSNIDSIERIS